MRRRVGTARDLLFLFLLLDAIAMHEVIIYFVYCLFSDSMCSRQSKMSALSFDFATSGQLRYADQAKVLKLLKVDLSKAVGGRRRQLRW